MKILDKYKKNVIRVSRYYTKDRCESSVGHVLTQKIDVRKSTVVHVMTHKIEMNHPCVW